MVEDNKKRESDGYHRDIDRRDRPDQSVACAGGHLSNHRQIQPTAQLPHPDHAGHRTAPDRCNPVRLRRSLRSDPRTGDTRGARCAPGTECSYVSRRWDVGDHSADTCSLKSIALGTEWIASSSTSPYVAYARPDRPLGLGGRWTASDQVVKSGPTSTRLSVWFSIQKGALGQGRPWRQVWPWTQPLRGGGACGDPRERPAGGAMSGRHVREDVLPIGGTRATRCEGRAPRAQRVVRPTRTSFWWPFARWMPEPVPSSSL